MKKRRGIYEIVSGLGLWLLLGTAVFMAVRLQLLFPRSLIEWLAKSPDPQTALAAFSAGTSSVLMALLRLGIEIQVFKPLFASESFREYVHGVPVWMLIICGSISALLLLKVWPVCQPPSIVNFKVQGRDETYLPTSTIYAVPGEFLAITAEALETNAVLSCKWQYIGGAFETVGSSNDCQTIVKLAGEPGQGLLTLQIAQNFCDQSSVFLLNVKVESP